MLWAAVELHWEIECASTCDGWLALTIGRRREDYDNRGGSDEDGCGGDAAGEERHDTNIIAKDERGGAASN